MNMRRIAVLLLLGWIILILQSGVVSYITYADVAPELLLVLTLHQAIVQKDPDGSVLWLSVAFGYLVDLFSSRPFGTCLTIYPLIGVAAGSLSRQMLLNGYLASLLVVAFFSGVAGVLLLGLSFVGMAGAEIPLTLARWQLQILANTGAAAVFFPILNIVERVLFRPQRTLL